MAEVEHILTEAAEMERRVALVREQEQAMRDVLPQRFEVNMAAFRRFVPSIAERFEQYRIQRPFEMFCTDNGIPNLRWRDDDSTFYGEDPYQECLQQVELTLSSSTIIRFNLDVEGDWIGQQHIKYMNALVRQMKALQAEHPLMEQIPESMPLGLMFGVGLGYQLAYLYERCQIANLYLFEPNEDLFYASLHAFDWAPLLEYLHSQNMGLHIFLGQQEDEVLTAFREVSEKRSPFLCSTAFGLVHYRSEVLQGLVGKVAREMFFISMGWGFFDDTLFSLSQSLNNMEAGVPFFRRDVALPAEWRHVPVFIVANGPSFDRSVELIRQHQDKAIVIACGTAVTALHKAGICPDIYLAVERITSVPASLRSIGDPEYLQRILCIGPDVLHPDCRDLFRDRIYGFKGDEPMFSLLFANTELMQQYRKFAFINPLVGNIGVSLPLHLGFDNLYLLGLDNGYRSAEHHHSKYSFYYDDKGETKNEFKQMALAQGDCVLPANFGGEVISNRLFAASVLMMEVALSHFPHAQCHNCSDGAAIQGAMPLPPEALDLADFPVLDKSELRRFLLEQMSAPVPISRAEVADYMDQTFFSMLLARVKTDWETMPTSRLELIQLMQKQMEYLSQVALSRQRHISQVLYGTFNSLFTLITHLAYSISDEQQALAAVDALRPTMQLFFDTISRLYPYGLQLIQGQHQAIYRQALAE